MTEDDGCELAKSLRYNKSIERVTLDGNWIGPKFLQEMAQTLKVNKSIKYLDLEGNCLTKGNKENGIKDLFDALKVNDTLTTLNLNSTSLTDTSAAYIDKALNENHSLIYLDLEMNPGIELRSIRNIQKKVERNQQKYRQERKYEWQQRKNIEKEQKNIQDINKAREQEIRLIKDIQANADERQMKREQIFLERVKNFFLIFF